MIAAAGDRPCIEMGSRRTHEEAAVAAARAAYVAGFAATSNLEAGRTLRRAHRRHARARVHPAARHRARPRSRRRWPAWARARPCSSTPTTCRRRSRSRSTSPGPSWGPSGSTPATCSTQAVEVRAQLDSPRRHRDPDLVTVRPGRVRHRGPRRRPGRRLRCRHVPGHRLRRAHRRARLQAGRARRRRRRPGGRGQEEQGQDHRRRPEVGPAPARRATASPRPRSSGSASSRSDDGDDRPLMVELLARRRGGRHRARPAAARERHSGRVAELPPRARRLSRGEPAIPTLYENIRG